MHLAAEANVVGVNGGHVLRQQKAPILESPLPCAPLALLDLSLLPFLLSMLQDFKEASCLLWKCNASGLEGCT